MTNATRKTRSKASRKELTLEEVVAANVVRLRKARGWTQYDLADRMKRFQSWLARLERGKASPTLRTLADLAGAFGVKPEELLKRKANHA